MPEVWVTVTQSQVFNWVKVINDSGGSTDCISITDSKMSQEDVEKIENSIHGKFYQVHDYKRFLLSDINTFLALFKHYLKNVFKYDKIIFQTRIGIGTAYLLLNWLPKVKLIFEARGAGNEETSHSDQENKITLKKRIKRRIDSFNEKLLLNKSDNIFCVSEALRDYYVSKFDLDKNVFTVFPGAADAAYFFYDEKIRNDCRKKMNFDKNDIVIVYSGRLEMKWEIPDKIFEFFKDLSRKNKNFKLLLITPDHEIAQKLIEEFNFEESVMARSSKFEDVNKYLNAADVGLLLREDVIMNNVASPTKFAEYLLAGLPVIISHGIHDFAQNVKETGFGVVVDKVDTIAEDELIQLNKSFLIKRETISQWGLNNLSKEVFIKKYIKVLREI